MRVKRVRIGQEQSTLILGADLYSCHQARKYKCLCFLLRELRVNHDIGGSLLSMWYIIRITLFNPPVLLVF